MDVKYKSREPIAIIGIGCRFPGGASSPDKYWQLLLKGQDAIVDVPKDRWDIRRFYDPDPDKPGKSYVKQGGFLKERIDEFDPLFFGISPREAETMDPQQRLLLEVTWEAFEDAGLIAEKLTGSNTGVFIGGFCLDNLLIRVGPLNRELADTHTAASSTMTMLSNRISYIFDLKGPSVSMDTACSSSLVTTHYACQSLWNGEADMAIAGGVNIMQRPEFPIAMSKGHFLSEHGRCMTFDERAAGYTRGEGGGIVILKPLSAALKDCDRIYALIRMTGVNQDGHTPGISMPNSDAQLALIRSVYKKADISPGEVGYIEAHGTGTQAGDPKETEALDLVLSQKRRAGKKCLIGSVKTNIGHLEAGAGVAGLIKAALCVKHGKIPPSLHFKNPNPNIPFERMCLQVATDVMDWPEGYATRYAGVNSFGYGGTNAHILLQEPPAPSPDVDEPETWNRPYLFPVSARSETALAALAGKYAFYLTTHRAPKAVTDFLYSAIIRRSHHRHRLTMLAEDVDDLREKLQHFSNGDFVEAQTMGKADILDEQGLVFIYTGMGPQWWAMGRELMEKEPVFLETVRECDRCFTEEAGWSILGALQADEANSQMSKTEVAQPANFVIQVALTALWESWGIRPDAVIGHSVGEVASAYVCGALSLEDAIKVSFHRSRLQATTAGLGVMLAVGMPEADTLALLKKHDRVSIAAINSPASVTLSGDEIQLRKIAGELQNENIFNRFLQVEVAYHSHQMDPIKTELLESLAILRPQSNGIPLYSTVTGGLIDGTAINAEYWWRNVREPVRFAQGIQALLQAGFKKFVEIGPHPVLGHSVKEIAASAQQTVSLAPSLNRKTPEQKRMLESLGQLYTWGREINWHKIIPADGHLVRLPDYPWQKERLWLESEESRQDRLGLQGHVFLNNRVASPQWAWTVEINSQFFPFLLDHRVNKEVVWPGAAYVEAGLAVYQALFESEVLALHDLEFHSMLFVETKRVQLLGIDFDNKTQSFSIFSRIKEDGADWQSHASGRLVTGISAYGTPDYSLKALCERISQPMPIEDMYDSLSKRNLEYGPYFRRARELWTLGNEILVHINEPEEAPGDNYLLHPTVLDTAFQALLTIVPGNAPFVPVTIERIILHSPVHDSCWCYGIITEQTPTTLEADIVMFDEEGRVCLEIKNSFYRALDNAGENETKELASYLYEDAWESTAAADGKTDYEKVLLFSDDDPFSLGFEQLLETKNIKYIKAARGDAYARLNNLNYHIGPEIKKDMESLLRDSEHFNPDQIFYLWPLSPSPAEPDPEFMRDRCMELLRLVQTLSSVLNDKEISLVVFTRNSQTVTPKDGTANLNTAPLWGLGQLIQNEYPNIHCRLIDLDGRRGDTPMESLLDLISSENITHLALRKDQVYSKKLRHLELKNAGSPQQTESVSTDKPVVLVQQQPGRIDSFAYRQTERREPGADEIEIKVHFTGLNFKDVLKAFGKFPEMAAEGTYFGNTIGIDVAGTVVKTGPGVDEFKPGDEVIAAVRGSFRSYATVPARFVLAKPKPLKLEESLIHVVFSTAYYALSEVARVQAGETVLIHSAAGGLGLAAIQIARWLGATIMVTAGSEEKRDYLRSLDISHVMDSRSLSFIDEVQAATQNRGVDVILNTLTGEAMLQSFKLLAPYGRFIELGKQDIVKNSALPMSTFNRNITFTSVDFDRMHAEKADRVTALTEKISEFFNEGLFTPIPVTVYNANSAVDAFQYMAQGKHIGKIAVKFEDETVDVVTEPVGASNFDPQGTYLITGGTGGFGLEVARWLADKGVGRLVLVSRRGITNEDSEKTIAAMRENGVDVEVHKLDITDHNSVKKLVDQIQTGLPLRGVVHAATVYQDAFIKDIDDEVFSMVFNPKVQGALNLYHSAQDLDLRFLVFFSSISSLVGNRGQANYIAGNSFLDEFAQYLRKHHVNAFTINWGALSESGVVARNEAIGHLLQQGGVRGMSNRSAIRALDYALAGPHAHVGVFDVDWKQWALNNNQAAQSVRFAALVNLNAASDGAEANDIAMAVYKELDVMSGPERLEHIEKMLREGLSKVLRLDPDKIDVKQNLNNMGIDSLMMLELTLIIQNMFGIEMPTMELLKHPTLKQVAEKILNKLLAIAEKHGKQVNTDIDKLAAAIG